MRRNSCLRRNAREEGFTLIELLVVILIIGILVAVAIPQYFKVAERARLGDAENFMSLVNQSQQRYMTFNGAYLSGDAAAIANLDISFNGASPGYGMQNFVVTILAPSPGGPGCPGGINGFVINLARSLANTACDGSYCPGGVGYVLTYDSCAQPAITCSNLSCQNELL